MENWVKVRQECSPFEMFVRLQKGVEEGVEEDVRIRTEFLGKLSNATFRVVSHDDNKSFTVIREILQDNSAYRSAHKIDFSWSEKGIAAKDHQYEVNATLTLTLLPEGFADGSGEDTAATAPLPAKPLDRRYAQLAD